MKYWKPEKYKHFQISEKTNKNEFGINFEFRNEYQN
jgi:hypothetical protein